MYKIAFIILLLPSLCFATKPVINSYTSGTVNVTYGGDKTTAAPVKWADFEDGTDGVVIAGSNNFGVATCTDCWADDHDGGVNAEPPKYSNIDNKTGSTLNVRQHYDIDNTGSESESLLAYQSDKNITDKLHVSFWVRYDWGTPTPAGLEAWQWKVFRVVDTNSRFGWPGIVADHWTKPGLVGFPDTYSMGMYYSTTTPSYPSELKVVQDANPFGDQEWGFYQIWWKGDPTNGELHTRQLNPTDGTYVIKDYTGTTLTEGNLSTFIFAVGLTNVTGTYELDTTMYFDDIYIDDSWARVEFGDNAVYDDCTHREMQIPTGWPTGESAKDITTTENFGSLDQNDDIYIFVTNNSGETSDGFLIIQPTPTTLGTIKGFVISGAVIK